MESGTGVFNMCFCVAAFLSAGPIGQKSKAGQSIQEKAEAAANHRRLIRNRRNVSWYKQHSDFWAWYKYFTDNGNQEAVSELDRIYLAYLQNKNRAEGRRSYKAYLRHLGDIYKSCSDSDDPNCVAAYTSRSKAKPEPPKPAPLKTCDPTNDQYCLYMALVQGKSPYKPLVLPVATSAPAPVKGPAPLYMRAATAPVKGPESGYYYYAPSAVPFLSKEQKAELLRICAAEDTECLQYHLRAAFGYAPAAVSQPSYAHLGCDPKKDPSCKAKLVQKAPSSLHMQYPNCDSHRDPYCTYAASLVVNPPAHAGPGSCNPLYEEGCNPLTTTRFASPPDAYTKGGESEEAAAIRSAPPAPSEQYDPYAMFRDPYANANRIPDPYAMYRQYPFAGYEEPPQEERHHPLGPPGKTKEGYDCYIGYDQECIPLRPNNNNNNNHPRFPPRHPLPAQPRVPEENQQRYLEPSNPDCDPEYDADCRLRRYEPEQAEHHEEEHSPPPPHPEREPHPESHQPEQLDPYETQSGQDEPHMAYPGAMSPQSMPTLQDILRRYGDQFPEQEEHRAYAGDYRKK
uniref:Actinodin1 n=1 Tax=Neogobius melanostomus TaxID=47308 RepID=A0A8C6UN03_9GOBI